MLIGTPMTVSTFEVTRREPFAYDYERIDGKLHFAVDPLHSANRRIVDLDKAPRNAEGRVTFSADFVVLQPADPRKANRRLLYYVVNRGLKDGVPLNRVPARSPQLPPNDDIDPGDGFLMRHGWTVAMCGWQWDMEQRPMRLGLDAPQALGPDGQPIRGRISVAFQPNEPHSAHLLAHWPLHPPPGKQTITHTPYPAADVNESTAQLTTREWSGGPSTVVPRERWRFARVAGEGGQPVPDDRYVWLDGGFEPGRWYEVTYTTRICPVVGTGLLATRDSVAWLRRSGDEANPARGRVDFAYALGRSQCGRFLRDFVYEGLNVDEDGRQVFDGIIPHVAGARRGEFNQRFAQPSDTNPRSFGGLPPFTTDDLLARQRELGGVPKVFTTNTSSEYWRSDCSLVHTDPSGTRDLEPAPEERIYLIAGHQHGSGAAAVNDTTPAGARTANNLNVVDGNTVVRAFLVNLDRWVSEGIEPPPNAYPRLADGTAVPREQVLDALKSIPGLVPLDTEKLPKLRRINLGPDVDKGIASLPAEVGEAYPSFAPAVDDDGNERVGIRLPDVSVPVGTHLGWVARHPSTGGAGQTVDMMGATLPFAATDHEREERGDPRPSLAERYRDRADYVAKARAAAQQLAAERYLLDEDVDLAVELAAQRYDLFARTPAGVGDS